MFISAFIIGLMGAGHCLGMCGGISAALSFAIPDASFARRFMLLLTYNIGRMLSYVAIGVVAGYIGQVVGQNAVLGSGVPLLRTFAAVMLILMGFYVTGWWKVLGVLERIGAKVWRYIQPLSQKLMPVKSLNAAFLLGALWGWLPCGLVYSVLALAMAQANPFVGAGVMFAFGLGTLPAVLAGGMAGERLKKFLQAAISRGVMGLMVIGFGAWTLYFAFQHADHDQHASHHDAHLHTKHEKLQQEQSQSPGSDYTEKVLEPDPTPDGAHHHHH